MRVCLFVLLIIGLGCATDSSAKPKKRRGGKNAPGTILLNGERTDVAWSDGDSFKVKSGQWDGKGTRLVGFNTLEAYGPVHRWGDWTAKELSALAKSSGKVAAAQEWTCTTDGKLDGYKRLLVLCPDLVVEMVRQGHAFAFAVDEKRSPDDVLAAQAEAIREKRGMWEKGSSKFVISSLHSADEDGSHGGEAYNRVVDTRTGAANKLKHKDMYATCQEVCLTLEGDTSCMTYVPFNIRYRNKPDCLK